MMGRKTDVSYMLVGILWIMMIAMPHSAIAKSSLQLPRIVNTSELSAQGQGQLRRYGLKVFDAKLWQSKNVTQPVATPYALQLRYNLNIPADKIIEASITEMRKQGVADHRLVRWRKSLDKVIPDVKKGDVITGVNKGNHAEFYLNGRLMGKVSDKQFGQDFFGIWLDANTSEPKLRRQLLQIGN